MSDPTGDPTQYPSNDPIPPDEPAVPEVPEAPAPEVPADEPPEEPEVPGTGDADAVAAAQAHNASVIQEHTDAIADVQKAGEPWVQVSSIQPGQTAPAAPTGEDAELKVVTHDGVSFFHTVATLPKHLKDAVGNVIFGQHFKTTIDGPVTETPVDSPPAEEPPA